MRWFMAPICVLALVALSAPRAHAFGSLGEARRALAHKQPAERAKAAVWIGRQGALGWEPR